MVTRLSSAEIPYTLQAGSVDELGITLARNALNTSQRPDSDDSVARSICGKILEGIRSDAAAEQAYFLFNEDFYTTNEKGRNILNGALIYKQSLLRLLGHTASMFDERHSNSTSVRQRITSNPETNEPHRRWEWRSAGLIQVVGHQDVLVMEGSVQRWRTRPRPGWLDFFQFGALVPAGDPVVQSTKTRVYLDTMYSTLATLPIDKLHPSESED